MADTRASSTNCEADLAPPVDSEDTLREAWITSKDGFDELSYRVKEGESALESMMAVLLAQSNGYLFGEGGGAKTLIAKQVFLAELRSFSENEKRLFLKQFHRLVTEYQILGSPKLDTYLTGIEEIETSTSMMASDVYLAVLDEIDKANPATLVALLSILNERKAFLGTRILPCFIAAIIATSNKNLNGLLNAEGADRRAVEAVFDRTPVKRLVPDQPSGEDSFIAMFIDSIGARGGHTRPSPVLMLNRLRPLLSRVQIPAEVEAGAAMLITELDKQFTPHADPLAADVDTGTAQGTRRDRVTAKQKMVVANMFSNRNARLLITELFPSAFIVHQLISGVPYDRIRYVMRPDDLVHLAETSIFGGPGRLRKRTQPLVDKLQVKGKVFAAEPVLVHQAYVDAYDGFVRYVHPDEPGVWRRFSFDTESGAVWDGGVLYDEEARALILEAARAAERSVFETENEDDELTRARALPTVNPDILADYDEIKYERDVARDVLRTIFDRVTSGQSIETLLGPVLPLEPLDVEDLISEIDELMARRARLNVLEKQRLAWLRATLLRKSLAYEYFESEHVIQALFTGLVSSHAGNSQDLARSHVSLYGPPGGAKTAIANDMTAAALAAYKENHPEADVDVYFRQFHAFVPEGAITGYQDIIEQERTGRIVFNVKTSLVNPRNLFGLLDEVDKATPGVRQQLFGVLNEGPGPIFCVLSFNQTPQELIRSFGIGDEGGARAFLDRMLNKVYVSNKFSDPRLLLKLVRRTLRRKAQGASHDITYGGRAVLDTETLGAMARSMRYKELSTGELDQRLIQMATRVQRQSVESFMRSAIAQGKAADDSRDPMALRYYPTTTGSGRTFKFVTAQLPAAVLMDRLFEGRDYDDIGSMILEHKDIVSLRRGLAGWIPTTLQSINVNGRLQYEVNSIYKTTLLNREYIDKRQRFILQNLIEEQNEVIAAVNQVYTQTLISLEAQAHEFSRIFPTLVISPEEVEAWVHSQAQQR